MYSNGWQPQYIKCGYCGKTINASELKVEMAASTEEVIQAGVNPVFTSIANYSVPPHTFCPCCNHIIVVKGFK